MKRVLYEEGASLSLNDLRAEQNYFNEHRGLINAELYTHGILEGLTVQIDESIIDEPALIVLPGTALAYSVHGEKDALREIILLEEDRLLLSGILEDAPEGKSDYYLSISHLETEDDESRRTLELPLFNITVAAPADPGKRLTLARLIVEKSGEDIVMSLDPDQSIRPLIRSRLNASRIYLNQEQNQPLTLREELDSLRGGNSSVEKELVSDEYLPPLFLRRGDITQESWGRDEIRISSTTLLLEKEDGSGTVVVDIPETILELEGTPGVVLDGVAKNLIKARHKTNSPVGYELYVEASPAMGREAVLEYFTGKPGGAFEFLGGEEGYALTPTRTDGTLGKFQARAGAVITARDLVSILDGQVIKYGDIKETKKTESNIFALGQSDFQARTLDLKNGNMLFQYTLDEDAPVENLRLIDSEGFEIQEMLVPGDTLSKAKADLYALEDGGFIFIYGSGDLRYTRFNASGQMTDEDVELTPSGISSNRKIVQASNGNFVLFYSIYDGSDAELYIRVFNPETSGLTTPHLIQTKTGVSGIYATGTWGAEQVVIAYQDIENGIKHLMQTFSNEGVPQTTFDTQIDQLVIDPDSSHLLDLRNGNVAFFWFEYDSEEIYHLKLNVYGTSGELLVDTQEIDAGYFLPLEGDAIVLDEGAGFVVTYYLSDLPEDQMDYFALKYRFFAMGLDHVVKRTSESLVQNPAEFAYPFYPLSRSTGNGKFCLSYLGLNKAFEEDGSLPEGLELTVRFFIYDMNSNTLGSETQISREGYSSIGRTLEPLKDGSGGFVVGSLDFIELETNEFGTYYYEIYNSEGILLSSVSTEEQLVAFESPLVAPFEKGTILFAHELNKDGANTDKLEYFFLKEQTMKPFGVALQDALSGDELNVQIDGVNKEFRELKSGKKYYTLDGSLTRDSRGDFVGTALGADRIRLKPGS